MKTTIQFLALTTLIFVSACKKDDPLPTADFSFSGTCTAPCQVSFTNLSKDATSYSWNFGDGGSSTETNPAHSFSSGGSYTVTLTATGSGGTATKSQTVSIAAANLDRYVNSVRVLNVTSSNWDNFSGPDLQVKFSKSSSTNWDYVTNIATDQSSVPYTLYFSSPILVTNENWDIILVDEDTGTYDVIYTLYGFNPKTSGSGGKIQITVGGQVVMELNYTEQ